MDEEEVVVQEYIGRPIQNGMILCGRLENYTEPGKIFQELMQAMLYAS